MKRLLIIAALVFAGCASNPVIFDISDSALKVQQPLGTPDIDVQTTANQGCSLYDKRATRISHTCADQYCLKKYVLFACR